LYIALLAAAIDLVIGVAYGGISAFYGGRVDNIMQRIMEIINGIPYLIIVILMVIIMGSGIWSITLAMAITGWIGMSRIVRGQILKLKNQEYVLSSRTLGATNTQLIVNHLIPNVMGPIIVMTMFT
ncbi:ABC transporter permease, partial [Klebsiella pneumoniae]|nr:ABC transporter permease [Klebsiella pneumoniae]